MPQTAAKSTALRNTRKVVAIRGKYVPDVVKQTELADAYTLFMMRHIAALRAQKAALLIEGRLLNGATVEPGGWNFDRGMRFVIAPGHSTP